MIRLPPSLWLLGLALAVSPPTREPALQTGDLVLQTSRSEQSRAIQEATGSPWSHVGVVEVTPEGAYVIEAEGRVVRTPWKAFRDRGEGRRVLVLRAAELPAGARAAAVVEARRFLGLPYDPRFSWGDDALYCSELAVKAFERGAGVTLGRRERLGALRLERLGGELAKRYGGPPPLEQELVTPASIADDARLSEVFRG
jgi:hypothetical protein